MAVIDKIRNLIQQSDAGGLPQFGVVGGSEVLLRAGSVSNLGVFETAVVSLAARRGSEVRIDADEAFTSILIQPSPSMTQNLLLQDMVWYSLTHNGFSMARTGMDDLRIFPPLVVDPQSRDKVALLSDQDGQHRIPFSRLANFVFHRVPSGSAFLGDLRKQESTLSELIKGLTGSKGVVSIESIALDPKKTEEEHRAELKELADTIKTHQVSAVRGSMNFTATPQNTKLEELQNNIFRSFCRYYGVPTALFGVDVPSHTNMSLSQANIRLVQNCLSPIFSHFRTGVRRLFNTDIMFNFDKITGGVNHEKAQAMLALAQTGVYQINELRAMDDLPSITGGDEMPNAAGSPPSTEGDNDETQSEDEEQ